ncbi:MAG: Z1 domain-containing protein [Candidatus Cryptobacteroides sp.]|nr:Z1 domain-containing protein [Candidatus Cryptobacteroides sp.]
MEQIIVNKGTKTDNPKKNVLQEVTSGEFFEKFIDYIRRSESNPKGLSNAAIATFREEACDVLAHCNPHNAVNFPETTHLAVGYVQSGKTMSFTGVTALAKDNGYRVIIYLAGTKNNLLDQTQKRLRKDLIGKNGANNDYYKIHPNPTATDIDDIVGNLESIEKPIVLIPILKHYDHILKVRQIFNNSEVKELMANETVIIIDDEADQASLNSYGRRNSKYEEDAKSRTYDAILKLRADLPGNTYIQYTATPQANILISMQDLLSPKSHTLLTPGEGYVGGKLFFGKGDNGDLYNGELIIEIPEKEVFHKKYNPLTEMPQSLRDALMMHTLAVAIVVKYLKVDGVNYLSMMVHPDNTIDWNKTFWQWIDTELKTWRRLMGKSDDNYDKVQMLRRFEQLFPLALEHYEIDERPSFEEIKPLIAEVLKSKKVYLVNTDAEAQTEIQWDDYKMHILVGAEMLNRGFTVEKLATTYMPRYTKGATNADTIQQRCRFFGYKMDYIKSCRVFLPGNSIANYLNYVTHEEELRSTLASCDSLEAAERKVLLSPSLRPTRANVLPIWVVNTRMSGMNALQAFSSKSTIERNDELVAKFLQDHEHDWTIHQDTTLYRTHRWLKLGIDDAIQFLSDFNFKNWPDAQRKADTIRYLRYLAGASGDDKVDYVYFYQMAFGAPAIERNFDAAERRLAANTQIFAGPSSATDSTNYPGDAKIVGSHETLTFQLYHIRLKGAELDYPKEAYTMAIYVPKELAATYTSNEQYNIDDSDDEED